MMMTLDVYRTLFQDAFLEQSRQFYLDEGNSLILTLETPDYLQHVEKRLNEETDRVTVYLNIHTKADLILTVEEELIRTHVDDILERGFVVLMEGQKVLDLQRMFSLLARVNSLPKLCDTFRNYVVHTGSSIVLDEEGDDSMVENLLKFKETMDTVVLEAFRGKEEFEHTLKSAFEEFIDKRRNKPAELVAKFLDRKLRSRKKDMTDEELDHLMDKLMVIFRFIQGKDVFEAFYKKDLAKRLLLGRSTNVDAEKAMISKLKSVCGAAFTNKLESMFKDTELSKELMKMFQGSKEVMAFEQRTNMSVSVNVLTTGAWPAYPDHSCVLPEKMMEAQRLFASFYESRHSGRRLAWQPVLGQCVLAAYFPKGKKELSVSLYQALILLLFNQHESLTTSEIIKATGIDSKEVVRNLQSLANAKIRVLRKTPQSREVLPDDHFAFRADFSHKLIRIKVNTIQMKETKEENQSTNEKVFQDRQWQIDAAIVRIMKSRKVLSHNMLMSELLEQLKFHVNMSDIKKRIESLIDREYMERDAEDSKIYKYLA